MLVDAAWIPADQVAGEIGNGDGNGPPLALQRGFAETGDPHVSLRLGEYSVTPPSEDQVSSHISDLHGECPLCGTGQHTPEQPALLYNAGSGLTSYYGMRAIAFWERVC